MSSDTSPDRAASSPNERTELPVVLKGTLPLTVLVSGGIASGKSTVAKMVAACGGEYVDCDRMAHEVLARDDVGRELRDAFGDGIFAADGSVDRQALGAVVFRDEAALLRLEAIVHPHVNAGVQARLDAARTPPGTPRKVVVIDAAVAERMKLGASRSAFGWRFDLKLFVSTTPETRRRRAVEIRGWEPGELERREARQNTPDSKRSQADCVVPNDGELEEANSHVKQFWSEHVEPRL